MSAPLPSGRTEALVVTVREAGGVVYENVCVHGAGGAIAKDGGLERLRALIKLAERRVPLRIYEPRPGFVWAYRLTATGIAGGWEVDLRGATLLAKEGAR